MRSFDSNVSEAIETEMRRIASAVAAAHGLQSMVEYSREFVPLINDAQCVLEAFDAARDVVGVTGVDDLRKPITGSEDFARFIEHVPGCFTFIGNGEQSPPLHNPAYDFADGILSVGARFHAALVRRRLPLAKQP